jgi:hypothetical protein
MGNGFHVEHEEEPGEERGKPTLAAFILSDIANGNINGSRPAFPSRPDITLYDLILIGDRERWQVERMARMLGVGRATLWRCLKRLGLSARNEQFWIRLRDDHVRVLVVGGPTVDETSWNLLETNPTSHERFRKGRASKRR